MKKALHIIGKIFTYLVVALAIFMMIFTVISVSTFNRNDRDLFGYKAFIVKTVGNFFNKFQGKKHKAWAVIIRYLYLGR